MAGLLLGVWVAHLPHPACGASEGLWMAAGLPRAAVLSVEASSSAGLQDLGQGSAALKKAPAEGQTCDCTLPFSHSRSSTFLCQRG